MVSDAGSCSDRIAYIFLLKDDHVYNNTSRRGHGRLVYNKESLVLKRYVDKGLPPFVIPARHCVLDPPRALALEQGLPAAALVKR